MRSPPRPSAAFCGGGRRAGAANTTSVTIQRARRLSSDGRARLGTAQPVRTRASLWSHATAPSSADDGGRPVGSARATLAEDPLSVTVKLRCGRFGGPIGTVSATVTAVCPGTSVTIDHDRVVVAARGDRCPVRRVDRADDGIGMRLELIGNSAACWSVVVCMTAVDPAYTRSRRASVGRADSPFHSRSGSPIRSPAPTSGGRSSMGRSPPVDGHRDGRGGLSGRERHQLAGDRTNARLPRCRCHRVCGPSPTPGSGRRRQAESEGGGGGAGGGSHDVEPVRRQGGCERRNRVAAEQHGVWPEAIVSSERPGVRRRADAPGAVRTVSVSRPRERSSCRPERGDRAEPDTGRGWSRRLNGQGGLTCVQKVKVWSPLPRPARGEREAGRGDEQRDPGLDRQCRRRGGDGPERMVEAASNWCRSADKWAWMCRSRSSHL